MNNRVQRNLVRRRRFLRFNQRFFLAAILFVVVITVMAPFASPRAQPPISQINQLYVFGDSLSDVGNVFRATGGLQPSSPPYFQGHFCNGQIWIEQLGKRLNLTPEQMSNFAWGGATTGQSGISGVPGVLAQIDQFTQTNRQANPQALYVVWAGANDYLHDSANPTASVSNLTKAVQTLADMGARRILVANLPDLGKLPATRASERAMFLAGASIAHNRDLQASLNTIQQKSNDVQIIPLNIYSAYQEAITNPKKFGFTNVTSSCLDSNVTCNQPNQFLFWDAIHPTTAGHKILGDIAFSDIQHSISAGRNSVGTALHASR